MPLDLINKPPYYQPAEQLKIYKALMTQAGSTAPTATIIRNTIGEIIWTRSGVGIYLGTLTAAFIANKVWAIISNTSNDATATFVIARLNDNQIKITTIDTVFNDGWLTSTPIEINILT